jgi:hypothetical protein
MLWHRIIRKVVGFSLLTSIDLVTFAVVFGATFFVVELIVLLGVEILRARPRWPRLPARAQNSSRS